MATAITSEDLVYTQGDSIDTAVESIVECLHHIDRFDDDDVAFIADYIADTCRGTLDSPRPVTVFIETDKTRPAHRDETVDAITDPESDLERVLVPSDGGPLVESVISAALDNGLSVLIVPVGPITNVTGHMSDILDDRSPLGQEWSGRPPLGFEVQKGRLVESSEYRRVRAVLKLVDDGELSKRAAARELDVSRRTIGRALDNPGRYGLSG